MLVAVSEMYPDPSWQATVCSLLNTNDREGIASRMPQVLTDDRLVLELRGRGTRQARKFGVDRMVSGILSGYERAVRC